MRFTFPLSIVGLCVLTAAGCGTVPAGMALATFSTPIKLELGAAQDAETCFLLAADERIEYQFDSSAALHFNLHTHRGREVFSPIDVRQTRSQSGVYVAPQAEDYCMMWTNPGAIPAHVAGTWRRIR